MTNEDGVVVRASAAFRSAVRGLDVGSVLVNLPPPATLRRWLKQRLVLVHTRAPTKSEHPRSRPVVSVTLTRFGFDVAAAAVGAGGRRASRPVRRRGRASPRAAAHDQPAPKAARSVRDSPGLDEVEIHEGNA